MHCEKYYTNTNDLTCIVQKISKQNIICGSSARTSFWLSLWDFIWWNAYISLCANKHLVQLLLVLSSYSLKELAQDFTTMVLSFSLCSTAIVYLMNWFGNANKIIWV